MIPTFNSGLLRVGRQLRGLTQGRLAEILDVPQGKISRWESGISAPTEEDIDALARELQLAKEFFVQRDRVCVLPMSYHLRAKATTAKSILRKTEARLDVYLMHFRRLLKYIEIPIKRKLLSLDPDQHGGAEGVAALLRTYWKMTDSPTSNLIECLEDAGCLVVPVSELDVDGFSIDLKEEGLPPCIFYNQEMPADRQRFTLAHELGHLVMHVDPRHDMEKEANTFAGAFLLPQNVLQEYASGVFRLDRLAELKRIFGVSMQALIYRSHQVGLISETQKTHWYVNFRTRGWHREEPIKLKVERPHLLTDVFVKHFKDMGYSMKLLCTMLLTDEDTLRAMYPWVLDTALKLSKPNLRLVADSSHRGTSEEA